MLTGEHWENGSASQRRLSPELLNTACILREVSDEGRDAIDEALRIVREAVRALKENNGSPTDPEYVSTALRDHSRATLGVLESAYRIQSAVLSRVARESERRLEQSPPLEDGADPASA